MKIIELYHNEEYLPTGPKDAQKILTLHLPSIQKWFISAPFYIGINKSIGFTEYACVIFGFGLIYNLNWDV